jgi:dolichol-phosphate mannosyltransferase
MNRTTLKLSIIIPLYNEERTVEKTLKRVSAVKLTNVLKEIIVIDDGSSDGSYEKVKRIQPAVKSIVLLRHKKNKGKGAAVRTGIRAAKGEYVLIQDADLEYNPNQITSLLMPILDGEAEVVYGTRLNRMPDFTRDERKLLFLVHYVGNRMLSLITSVLYGQWITDMETCYKLFPKKALTGITLQARGFELEPEITAKLMKKGYKIHEVPIVTTPRGYNEGKKLHTIRDGVKALMTLIKYRFAN